MSFFEKKDLEQRERRGRPEQHTECGYKSHLGPLGLRGHDRAAVPHFSPSLPVGSMSQSYNVRTVEKIDDLLHGAFTEMNDPPAATQRP